MLISVNNSVWLRDRNGRGGRNNPGLMGLPTPAAAAGPRRLVDGFTGSAMTVRRASDNATQNIGFIGNGLDIPALLAFVGNSVGTVVTLFDQSGNNRNFTQASAASQPRIVNNGVLDTLNGEPTIVFDGVDDFMSQSNAQAMLQNVPAAFIFVAARNNNATNDGTADVLYSHPSALQAVPRQRLLLPANASAFSSDAVRISTDAVATDSVVGSTNALSVLTSATRFAVGGTIELFRNLISNGSTVLNGTLGNTENSPSALAPTLGADILGLQQWSGQISEIIIYNIDQTANTSEIQKRMMAFYSIVS